MGSLAWLRYLSHTQVIESSNLSSSTETLFQSILNLPFVSIFVIIKESKS